MKEQKYMNNVEIIEVKDNNRTKNDTIIETKLILPNSLTIITNNKMNNISKQVVDIQKCSINNDKEYTTWKMSASITVLQGLFVELLRIIVSSQCILSNIATNV